MNEDIKKRLVFKQGPNFYYPNREPIPVDTVETIQELVQKFAEKSSTEEAEKKANAAFLNSVEKQTMQMPSATLISTNRWEMWSPPEMHYGEEDEDNHIGFGLRRSQRIGDKEKGSQAAPSQPQNARKLAEDIPKPPAPNQQANKPPAAVPKKRPSYPGAWVEGASDDSSSEASEILEPTSGKGKNPEKNSEEEPPAEIIERGVDKAKVGGGLRKKILKQSFTLTLEELLCIAPKFIQELQQFSVEGIKPVDRSQNSRRCNPNEFEEEQDCRGKAFHPTLGTPLTYACPLGFVDVTINGRKIKALVDSGAELNIMPESVALQLKLPTREISMNITGIGGHSSPIVGLAEAIPFHIDTEDNKAANFFIVRGKVYTVLGRPFLADHKVRLELSQTRGEILSYELWDGGRLCIPICAPEIPGWEMAPPRRLRDKCTHALKCAEYMDQEMLEKSKSRIWAVTDEDQTELGPDKTGSTNLDEEVGSLEKQLSKEWKEDQEVIKQEPVDKQRVLAWDILDQISSGKLCTNSEDVPEIDWNWLENAEICFQKQGVKFNFSILEPIEEDAPEGIGEGDMWKETLLELGDWEEDLGAGKSTKEGKDRVHREWEESEAQQTKAPDIKPFQINHHVNSFHTNDWTEDRVPCDSNLQFEETRIIQASRLNTQDMYNTPLPENKYSQNFWIDERPCKLFRKIFSEEWHYREIQENYQLLQELPGGGTSNLDFIFILTDIGAEAFLKEGEWNSRYGNIGYKLRLSIYNEDKKGLRWAKKNIPVVKQKILGDSSQKDISSWENR